MTTRSDSWLPDLSGPGPLAQSIVRQLERDIEAGRLAPGERLPTHRALAEALGVTTGTVSRAYAEARRRGLVRGRVGRGTFVAPPEPPALRPAVAHGGRRPIDLGVNLPMPCPEADLAAALVALARDPALEAECTYHDPAGSARARAAGARWLARLGHPLDAEQVVVCNGAQHAIDVALAATAGPGELVLAEAYTYPGFLAAARRLGLRVRGVALDGDGLVPDALEEICRHEKPRLLYCQPTNQNPTGARLPQARRERIAAIARAHDLVLLVDDVQGGMLRDPADGLGRLAPERTLTIGGLSKSLSPALRISFLGAPRDRVPRLVDGVWATVWMASPLGAAIATRWIEDGTAERTVAARREALAPRRALAERLLAPFDFTLQPGSSHLWLPLATTFWTGPAFAAALRERAVVVTPADAFQVGDAPAPAAVRLSLSGAPDLASLETALATVAACAAEPPPLATVRA